MGNYNWFEDWETVEKEEEPAVHGEPLLEGWAGLFIIVICILLGIIHVFWRPLLFIGVTWIGYEVFSVIAEYVRGVV